MQRQLKINSSQLKRNNLIGANETEKSGTNNYSHNLQLQTMSPNALM
jgi:hypothetical protein